MKEVKTNSGYNIQIYDSVDYSMFPDMKELSKRVIKDDDGEEREVSVKILQKEKQYNWLRIFVDESYGSSLNLTKGDIININFLPFNEVLSTTFATYEKKGLYKNQDNIVSYEDEFDNSVLCLMIDVDELYKLENMRMLFNWSKYYEPMIVRKDEITITSDNYGNIDYISLGL